MNVHGTGSTPTRLERSICRYVRRRRRGSVACKLSQATVTLALMSIDSDAVLRDALTLPSRERAAVAAELLASLDEMDAQDPETLRAAWAEELEERVRRAQSGEDPGEPWPALRDRLRSNFAP